MQQDIVLAFSLTRQNQKTFFQIGSDKNWRVIRLGGIAMPEKERKHTYLRFLGEK